MVDGVWPAKPIVPADVCMRTVDRDLQDEIEKIKAGEMDGTLRRGMVKPRIQAALLQSLVKHIPQLAGVVTALGDGSGDGDDGGTWS